MQRYKAKHKGAPTTKVSKGKGKALPPAKGKKK